MRSTVATCAILGFMRDARGTVREDGTARGGTQMRTRYSGRICTRSRSSKPKLANAEKATMAPPT